MYISHDHPLMPYALIKDDGKILDNVAFVNTDTGRVKMVDPEKQMVTEYTSRNLTIEFLVTDERLKEILQLPGLQKEYARIGISQEN